MNYSNGFLPQAIKNDSKYLTGNLVCEMKSLTSFNHDFIRIIC